MKPPRRRSIRLVAKPDSTLPGVVRIEVTGRKTALYAVREVPSQFGGRGFAVREIKDGPTQTYYVHVGGLRTCGCVGFAQWSRCKHVEGIAALLESGKL